MPFLISIDSRIYINILHNTNTYCKILPCANNLRTNQYIASEVCYSREIPNLFAVPSQNTCAKAFRCGKAAVNVNGCETLN